MSPLSVLASRKIIVIEDDADIAEIIVYNLEKEGYDAIATGRGDEGFTLVRLELPDVVILDLMLPGVDGLSICQQLKTDPATKIFQ